MLADSFSRSPLAGDDCWKTRGKTTKILQIPATPRDEIVRASIEGLALLPACERSICIIFRKD